jgi:hypothetical protein
MNQTDGASVVDNEIAKTVKSTGKGKVKFRKLDLRKDTSQPQLLTPFSKEVGSVQLDVSQPWRPANQKRTVFGSVSFAKIAKDCLSEPMMLLIIRSVRLKMIIQLYLTHQKVGFRAQFIAVQDGLWICTSKRHA